MGLFLSGFRCCVLSVVRPRDLLSLLYRRDGEEKKKFHLYQELAPLIHRVVDLMSLTFPLMNVSDDVKVDKRVSAPEIYRIINRDDDGTTFLFQKSPKLTPSPKMVTTARRLPKDDKQLHFVYGKVLVIFLLRGQTNI